MGAFLQALLACLLAAEPSTDWPDVLPGTAPLKLDGDPAALMVEGINRWLDRYNPAIAKQRRARWEQALASDDRARFRERSRRRLAKILGLRDERTRKTELKIVSPLNESPLARCSHGRAHYVRWSAFGRVHGEGILLQPEQARGALVIIVPDADWRPEQVAGLEQAEDVPPVGHGIMAAGYHVLIPAIVNRDDEHSGHPLVRYTNQPHREFVYRGAYVLGRHIIGYEIQQILAAIDAWHRKGRRVMLAGYGEGGLLAMYAAAIDNRIDAVLISGYVKHREDLWAQPIYRNVWTLVRDFGDAEVLSLIAPRRVVVEASAHPSVEGPPPPRRGRIGAAPGKLTTPPVDEVREEVEFARRLLELQGLEPAQLSLIVPPDQQPLSPLAWQSLLAQEGLRLEDADWTMTGGLIDESQRQRRLVQQLIEHTHWAWIDSQRVREQFWNRADRSSLQQWARTTQFYRDYFHREIVGKAPRMPEEYRVYTRKWKETPRWVAYQVRLDVYPPDVFAYGLLLIPRGELGKRPVVVCQHGLEGRPEHTVAGPDEPGYPPYRSFAARLADRGYVVYAPQNPYIGRDAFRQINRRANPLGLSMFSFIVEQHRRTLQWLNGLPFVDGRIGFYGLSYGGKTSLWVPSILTDYQLSICSANFNEWIWKNTSYRDRYSYVFTIEYEMFEFDLGNTFGHAELAGLIAPRPFMVERGHRDGVAPDEWVAYEYARVRRLYVQLGIPDRTEIEYFDGGHWINGVGTFRFLERHLPLK